MMDYSNVNCKLINIFLFWLIFISLIGSVQATSIGASPGEISFEKVLRGGYAENFITVSTASDEPVDYEVTVTGPFEDWLSFEAEEEIFTIPAKSHSNLKVIVQPPSDVPNGVYDGLITIRLKPKVAPGGGMGAGITAGVALKSAIEISGEEIFKYKVLGISVKDTEEFRPIEFSLEIMNEGNIKITPKIHIDILSEDKSKILNSLDYSEREILPTTKESILIKVPNDLRMGGYWAKITVYLGEELAAEKLLMFEVLERGSLSIQGELLKVELNKIWVEVGEIIKITSYFKNTGVLLASAKSKVEVSLEDKIIELLESEELTVPVGETVKLITYFTPKESGKYIILGKVFYSKKVTSEKSSILNVQPAPTTTTTLPPTTTTVPKQMIGGMFSLTSIIILVLVIALLLVLWKRKKSVEEGKEEGRGLGGRR